MDPRPRDPRSAGPGPGPSPAAAGAEGPRPSGPFAAEALSALSLGEAVQPAGATPSPAALALPAQGPLPPAPAAIAPLGRRPGQQQGPPPPVARVDLYTHRFSAACMQAKTLLDRKGVTYNEFIIDHDDESKEVMLKRSGGQSSVPQIFINGRGIGGTDQLEALDGAGQLDLLLGERPRYSQPEETAVAQTPQQGVGRFQAWNLLKRLSRP